MLNIKRGLRWDNFEGPFLPNLKTPKVAAVMVRPNQTLARFPTGFDRP